MSNRALNWAFDSGLPSGPRFVLVALADAGSDHSGEDWTCFPAVQRIVEMTGQGRSTVERHLSWLWGEGWISRAPRVRADGTLGINDYTLHRKPETRAALRDARASVERKPGRRPTLDLRDGPSLKSAKSIPQIGVQTTLDLRAQEPSPYPSSEPSTRAREPGDDGFDEVAALWPVKGRKFTRMPQARAAWAWAREVESFDNLRAAVAACAKDPDRVRGDHGWPGLDVFLRDEIWRGYLPQLGGNGGPPQEAFRNGFAEADELQAAIAQAAGENGDAFARYFLTRCQFEGTSAVAASAFVLAQLAPHAAVFKIFGLDLVGPSSSGGKS